MKTNKYQQIAMSWILFLCALMGTEIVIGNVIYPPIVRLTITRFSLRDPFNWSAKWFIYWAVVAAVLTVYYIFLTKTRTGRKWISWFIGINRPIFRKPQ